MTCRTAAGHNEEIRDGWHHLGWKHCSVSRRAACPARPGRDGHVAMNAVISPSVETLRMSPGVVIRRSSRAARTPRPRESVVIYCLTACIRA